MHVSDFGLGVRGCNGGELAQRLIFLYLVRVALSLSVGAEFNRRAPVDPLKDAAKGAQLAAPDNICVCFIPRHAQS